MGYDRYYNHWLVGMDEASHFHHCEREGEGMGREGGGMGREGEGMGREGGGMGREGGGVGREGRKGERQ